jgi:ankyrin repeat protein
MNNSILILSFIVNGVLYCANIPTKEEMFKAARLGNREIIENAMTEKQNLNFADQEGNTLLHYVAQKGDADLLQELLCYDEPAGYWQSFVRWLRGKKRPDVNAKNNNGDTPAHMVLASSSMQSLMRLIVHGADLNCKNRQDYTPLLLAAQKGKKEETVYLMGLSDKYYDHQVEGKNILHLALDNNYTELAEKIIEVNGESFTKNPHAVGNNALLVAYDNKHNTALARCVAMKQHHLIKKVLSYDKRMLNMVDKNGYTLIGHACLAKDGALISLLLNYKPELNTSGASHTIPLHIVCNNDDYDTAQVLLAHGADINVKDSKGNTLAHYACAQNRQQAINWLVQHNASLAGRNNFGYDALDLALNNNHKELVAYCCKVGIDIESKHYDGKTRLMRLLSQGYNEMAAHLIAQYKVQLPYEALHCVAKTDNYQGAHIILQKNKTFVHHIDADGNRPLHNTSLYTMAELFLRCGADPNACNKKQETALHRAAHAGDKSIIDLLKSQGASLAVLDHNNNSPAHTALSKGYWDCASSLLDPAIINVVNNEGKTLMDYAIQNKLSSLGMKKLIEYGADIGYIHKKTGNSYMHAAIAAQNREALSFFTIPALLNHTNILGKTPLSYAVEKGDRESVEFLLQKGAQVTIPDVNGCTALQHAIMVDKNSTQLFSLICSYSSLSKSALLLHTKDMQGNTFAHTAAYYGNTAVVKYLMSVACLSRDENNQGKTPLMCAAERGHLDVIKELLREDDFITGRVQRILTSLGAGSMHVRTYLNERLQARNRECEEITSLYNRWSIVVKENTISSSLLRQQTVKEYLQYAYTYRPTTIIDFSLQKLQLCTVDQRKERKALLLHALEMEERSKNEIQKRIAIIQTARDREIQKNVQNKEVIAEQAQVLNKPNAIIDTSSTVENNQTDECDCCNNIDTDAVKRCACPQCDKKMCSTCVQGQLVRGRALCLCQNPFMQSVIDGYKK